MRKIPFYLLTFGGLLLLFLCPAGSPPPRLPSRSVNSSPLKCEASRLKSTVIAATLDTRIPSHRNVLWCGSFQLAWNEACQFLGGDLRLDPPAPLANALNRKLFTGNDIDSPSYVALAGLVKDDIYGQIRRALNDKFAGMAEPELAVPGPEPHRPQDLVAYSYLFKNLQFEIPFGNLERALPFGKKKVAAFGMHQGLRAAIGSRALPELARQIRVLDYRDANDFVIELQTKSAGDRLLLAKVAPGDTLAITVAAVLERSFRREPVRATERDIFVAPKVNFDITRNYHELTGRRLLHQNPQVDPGLVLVSAVQKTRFQLNEQGAVLRSESRLHGGCSSSPQPQFTLIFDRPFLILMQRRTASTPYFALWVENAELLVPR